MQHNALPCARQTPSQQATVSIAPDAVACYVQQCSLLFREKDWKTGTSIRCNASAILDGIRFKRATQRTFPSRALTVLSSACRLQMTRGVCSSLAHPAVGTKLVRRLFFRRAERISFML